MLKISASHVLGIWIIIRHSSISKLFCFMIDLALTLRFPRRFIYLVFTRWSSQHYINTCHVLFIYQLEIKDQNYSNHGKNIYLIRTSFRALSSLCTYHHIQQELSKSAPPYYYTSCNSSPQLVRPMKIWLTVKYEVVLMEVVRYIHSKRFINPFSNFLSYPRCCCCC